MCLCWQENAKCEVTSGEGTPQYFCLFQGGGELERSTDVPGRKQVGAKPNVHWNLGSSYKSVLIMVWPSKLSVSREVGNVLFSRRFRK
jgi:hypothetical protein